MNGWVVIGIGDAGRSDDAAGIRAVQEFARRRPDIPCLCVTALGPELAEQVAAARAVVFVCTSVLVRSVSIQHLRPGHGIVSSHVATPDVLLGLCELLHGGAPGAAFLLEIPAEHLGPGDSLSPSTAAALGNAVAVLLRLIEGMPAAGDRRTPASS